MSNLGTTNEEVRSRSNDSLLKIKQSFNRIHDKLFGLNNMLIGGVLGLSKLPLDNPVFFAWEILFPVANLILLLVLEKYEMEVYRFESYEAELSSAEAKIAYGERHKELIQKQNIRSLLAAVSTGILLLYFIVSVILRPV